MEITRHDEDEVYEASRTGDVEYLNRLIEKDPEILRRISLQTGKTGTPLHVSALLGHAEFTKALCTENPKLAERVDADGRTPLHLASAEGHKETVEVLLSVYADACLRCDERGRIPLHYAAMNGEVEVLQKLIDKNPESIYVKFENRSKEAVLHLCIIHNQLECLKLLVERDDSNGEFLNSRAGCCDGSVTILHLALMLRQIKIIRYLLSVDAIRAEAIGVNGMSLTMLDILEYSSIARDEFSRSLEIQQILIDAGLIRRENNENDNPNSDVAAAAVVESPNPRRIKKKKKLHKQVAPSEKGSKPARLCCIKLMKWFRYPSNWLVEIRGMLMVVATMISTMTFQAAVNPPGGVWQDNNTNSSYSTNYYTGSDSTKTTCTEERACIAGTAVLGYIWRDDFVAFLNCNTISFLASLSVTLLLVSGFPLHNRLCMWLLSMSVCVTITFLALTYLLVLRLIVPPYFAHTSIDATSSTNIYGIPIYDYSIYVWDGLMGIVGVIYIIRFLIWVTKWLRRMYFRSKSCLKNKITTGSFLCNDPKHFQEIDAPAIV